MIKIEKKLYGDYDTILQKIEKGILKSSFSATLEAKKDFKDLNTRCSVRIFERYSTFGKNRVSLTISLFEDSSKNIEIFGVASGGSNGIFIKVNDIGESSFIEVLEDVIMEYIVKNV